MIRRKLSNYFASLLCLLFVTPQVPSLEIVSIHYQRKTDLEYRREVIAGSVPVHSLTICASKCNQKIRCVSFFFNIVDSLCQTEGRTRLSFDGSDAGPWQYYEMSTVNVAFTKTAWASTLISPLCGPIYALDGKVVLDGHAGQCTHTDAEINPSITIDLGAIYVVKYVTLINRIDTYGERLHDVFVTLGETNTQFPMECGQFKGPGVDSEVIHVVCPNDTRGRFVKTEIRGLTPTNYLVLCEIRVLIS